MDAIFARHHNRIHTFLLIMLLLFAVAGQAPRRVIAAPAETNLEFTAASSGTIANSGFTQVLPGTNPADTSKLTLNTNGDGTLTVQSTNGDLSAGAAQDNALSIAPYDSSGVYTIGARLRAPLAFRSSFQSAGIYIGKSNTAYIRFTIGVGSKRAGGERLQLDVMDNGKLRSSTIPLPNGALARIQSSLDLFLNIDHSGGGKITALYRIDSDNTNAGILATTRNFPRWLRQGNPTAIYTGIVTTNRGAPASVNTIFDWFRLTLAPQTVASVTGIKTVDRDGITGPTINPGDTLTYTIRVTNNGAATDVQVADPIPVDTAYIAGSATGGAVFDAAGNQVTWSGALGSGAAAEFTFKVKINQAPLQSTTILNTAALTYGVNNFPALLNASTIVGGAPDLSGSIYTATPAIVGPNEHLTYELTLVNDGSVAANTIAVRLTIPAGTSFVPGSASASIGDQATVDSALNIVNWNLSALAVNASATISFSVQAGNTFLNGASIASLAIIQAANILPAIETAQATYSVATSVAGFKNVDKAEVDPRDPLNNKLTYTITVANLSGAAASVQVIDPLPQDTSFVAGSLSTPAAGTASFDNNSLTWQIPALAAAQTVTVSFQVAVNPLPLHSSVILNKAVLRNNTDGVQTLLSAATAVKGMPDLSDAVYLADPGAVGPGGTITYALTLMNIGSAAANNASAQLSLPAGTTLVGAPTATNGAIAFDGAGAINWNADQVGIGGVVRISFQVQVTGQFANGAAITSQAAIQCTDMLPSIKTAQSIFNQPAQAPTLTLYLPIIMR